MFKKTVILCLVLVFFALFGNTVAADSTIGTNISTTGTLTVKSGSATAISFQNAAGTTTIFQFDNSNKRLGLDAYGGTLDTTLEVGGTASISGVVTLADGQIRPRANATTAFRFQNAAGTTTVFVIDTTNTRAGVNAGTLDTTFEVGGTASISGVITLADGQIRPQSNATTAFRLQNAAGTTTIFVIDTTNTRAGVNAGGAVDTTFEVGGAASISGQLSLGGNASSSGNFELTASSPLFGLNAGNVIDTNLEVGGTASISGVVTLADGQIRPRANATTAFRFQNAAGTTTIFVIDTTNTRAGVNAGTLDTTFEVGGTASISGVITLADGQVRPQSNATTAFRFQNAAGSTNVLTIDTTNTRVGIGSINTLDTALEVAGTASVSVGLILGTINNATTSLTFDSIHATRGACIEIKDADGSGFTYLRVNNGTATFSTTSCK